MVQARQRISVKRPARTAQAPPPSLPALQRTRHQQQRLLQQAHRGVHVRHLRQRGSVRQEMVGGWSDAR